MSSLQAATAAAVQMRDKTVHVCYFGGNEKNSAMLFFSKYCNDVWQENTGIKWFKILWLCACDRQRKQNYPVCEGKKEKTLIKIRFKMEMPTFHEILIWCAKKKYDEWEKKGTTHEFHHWWITIVVDSTSNQFILKGYTTEEETSGKTERKLH